MKENLLQALCHKQDLQTLCLPTPGVGSTAFHNSHEDGWPSPPPHSWFWSQAVPVLGRRPVATPWFWWLWGSRYATGPLLQPSHCGAWDCSFPSSALWGKTPRFCCQSFSVFSSTDCNTFALPPSFALSVFFFKYNFSVLVLWFNKAILLLSAKGFFLFATIVCTSAASHYHSSCFKLSSLKVTCFLTRAVKPNNDLMTPEQARIKITHIVIINNY